MRVTLVFKSYHLPWMACRSNLASTLSETAFVQSTSSMLCRLINATFTIGFESGVVQQKTVYINVRHFIRKAVLHEILESVAGGRAHQHDTHLLRDSIRNNTAPTESVTGALIHQGYSGSVSYRIRLWQSSARHHQRDRRQKNR